MFGYEAVIQWCGCVAVRWCNAARESVGTFRMSWSPEETCFDVTVIEPVAPP